MRVVTHIILNTKTRALSYQRRPAQRQSLSCREREHGRPRPDDPLLTWLSSRLLPLLMWHCAARACAPARTPARASMAPLRAAVAAAVLSLAAPAHAARTQPGRTFVAPEAAAAQSPSASAPWRFVGPKGGYVQKGDPTEMASASAIQAVTQVETASGGAAWLAATVNGGIWQTEVRPRHARARWGWDDVRSLWMRAGERCVVARGSHTEGA